MPRRGRRRASTYHFLSPEQFARHVAAGDFVEPAIRRAPVNGTPCRSASCRRGWAKAAAGVLEIELQGAAPGCAPRAEALQVFQSPASVEGAGAARLVGRGNEAPGKIEARPGGPRARARSPGRVPPAFVVQDARGLAVGRRCLDRQRGSSARARRVMTGGDARCVDGGRRPAPLAHGSLPASRTSRKRRLHYDSVLVAAEACPSDQNSSTTTSAREFDEFPPPMSTPAPRKLPHDRARGKSPPARSVQFGRRKPQWLGFLLGCQRRDRPPTRRSSSCASQTAAEATRFPRSRRGEPE